MTSDLIRQIEEERARIVALDSTLDGQRTPYLKARLRFAGHTLDDAEDGLRYAAKAPTDYNVAMWLDFTAFNIHVAAEMRQKVKAAVDKHGGPEHVIEMGG